MIGLLLFSAIASGILGGYIAKQKNRSLTEGAIIGFLFSVFGVIVVALLPSKNEDKDAQFDSKMQLLDIIGFILLSILIICLIMIVGSFID